jgi:hypothetical protein
MFPRKSVRNAPPVRGRATTAGDPATAAGRAPVPGGHAITPSVRATMSTAWCIPPGTLNAGPSRKRRLWDKPPPRGDTTKLPRYLQNLGIVETPFVNPEVCKNRLESRSQCLFSILCLLCMKCLK